MQVRGTRPKSHLYMEVDRSVCRRRWGFLMVMKGKHFDWELDGSGCKYVE